MEDHAQAADELAIPLNQVGGILFALPIPLQQHVIALLPAKACGQLRSSCCYLRQMVNESVTHVRIEIDPVGTPDLPATLQSDPLETRFPRARALTLVIPRCAKSADTHMTSILTSCSFYLSTATSLTLLRALDTSYPPSAPLIAALHSALASAPLLRHLRIDLPSADHPLRPPPPLLLTSLLPPTLHLPSLVSLHIDALFSSTPDPSSTAPLPSLTALSLSKLPITMSSPEAPAQLVSPHSQLRALRLGLLRQFDSGYISPDLQPLTALTSLTSLHIDGDGCMLTPASTSPLSALSALRRLDLATWRVMSTDALDLLALCLPLAHLGFAACFFEHGATLSGVAALTGLTSFALLQPMLYDQQDIGLGALGALTGLRQLAIEAVAGRAPLLEAPPGWLLALLERELPDDIIFFDIDDADWTL